MDLYIVTFSKHFGIHREAFKTFAEAWDFAAGIIRSVGGEISHPDAETAHKSAQPMVPALTQTWVIGKYVSHPALKNDGSVGPTVI